MVNMSPLKTLIIQVSVLIGIILLLMFTRIEKIVMYIGIPIGLLICALFIRYDLDMKKK
jgi:hypothetical protein